MELRFNRWNGRYARWQHRDCPFLQHRHLLPLVCDVSLACREGKSITGGHLKPNNESAPRPQPITKGCGLRDERLGSLKGRAMENDGDEESTQTCLPASELVVWRTRNVWAAAAAAAAAELAKQLSSKMTSVFFPTSWVSQIPVFFLF